MPRHDVFTADGVLVSSENIPDPSPAEDFVAAIPDLDPGTLAAVRDEITATLGDG